MDGIFFLIPLGLVMGLVGLGAFLWSLRSGQYEDLKGAAERILFEDDEQQDTGRPAPAEDDHKHDGGPGNPATRQ
ncbi:cbb3-type cytochrome oxidase assembly protein CcoS [Pelagibacterium lacus]|uniref:Cbb3-type cytochrome oxidase assembly protein CcoS n=1 Tax=Pelagibacterium lacus TaxID=2282655 RepID=A0A369W2F6_9HYPH|nr:cbb3-type cytochrome oxidase assembly protein CcoS [Pelagibacterium lacus]RDE08137.1 cbb3-type cytochrome oxidase assembly protein CcoS [Pelagibacterium lacus]